MNTPKLWKMFALAIILNIVFVTLVFILPYNPLQKLVGTLVSLFVFIFGLGIKVAVVETVDGFLLMTAGGKMLLYQTFYELLTIISLTIPLYLGRWKKISTQLLRTLAIILGYYIILYGTTIILFEKGLRLTVLQTFISFNTESFMFFAFILLWYILNQSRIKKIISTVLSR